jgi:hypothetical protein
MVRIRLFVLLAAGLTAGCSSGNHSGQYDAGGDVTGSATGAGNSSGDALGGSIGVIGPGGDLRGDLYLDGISDEPLQIRIFMSDDSQFRAFYHDDFLLQGSFNVTERLIDGRGLAIAKPGETWANGETVTTASFIGTLDAPTSTSHGQLFVAVSLASGDTGRIDAQYELNSGYLVGPAWVPLQGRWFLGPDADESQSIVVTDTGEFSGAGDDGCTLAGRFSLIDSRHGMWLVDVVKSECDTAGNYAGLAVFDANNWFPAFSFLTLSIDDGVHADVLAAWVWRGPM